MASQIIGDPNVRSIARSGQQQTKYLRSTLTVLCEGIQTVDSPHKKLVMRKALSRLPTGRKFHNKIYNSW